MTDEIKKTDGRGIISGKWLNQYHDITREDWLEDSFPEWGTLLNQEIETYEVPKGQVSLWWCGGPSWVLKTDEGGIYFIDQYCGPSMYTDLSYCGVCKQSGASSINWIRLNPQVIDPWKFNQLDGVFCTHAHQDHCDLYAINATAKTTDCQYYAPPQAAAKIENFGAPKERINVARVGESVKIKGGEVEFLMNYDQTIANTGEGNEMQPFDQVATCFLFKTSGGNILFMGDTWYHNGYVEFPQYNIDVAIFDMGSNAPGATDKMTPYDCARVVETIQTKVALPDHYDNWANTSGDPDLLTQQFERIVKENTPWIKTVIMRVGGRFNYPADQDIGRYKYPNGSENYYFSRSKYAQNRNQP